ncbi:MAG: hypothetical protein RIK87_05450 [Fuerstiella sp.]
MTQKRYQIRTKAGLSKPYTIDRLREKVASGFLPQSAGCTGDAGATFRPIAELLDQETASSDQLPETYSIPEPEPAARGTGRAGLRLPEPGPPVTESVPETGLSAVAQAAAAALEMEERQRSDNRSAAEKSPPPAEVPTGRTPEPDLKTEQADAATEPRRRRWPAVVIGAGMMSCGFLMWWFTYGGGPTNIAGEFPLRSFESGGSEEPLSLEALSARTQIMAIQLSRLNKAVLHEDVPLEELPLTDLELPALDLAEHSSFARLPMVPFTPRALTVEQQAAADDLLSRYAKLVREKSPDGRQLDAGTVDLYTDHLSRLMSLVDSNGPDRAAAVRELAELVKVMYLLQRFYTTSDEPDLRQQGLKTLMTATNAGLNRLYVELATGDMRFSEVFQRAEPAERAQLALVRYWYHRAVNEETASQWLDDVLKLVNRNQHATIQKSIAEIDGVED